MTDERQMDARLEVLAHYREVGPGERFFLWFSYPGLRDSFEAIDRAAGGGENNLLVPGPNLVAPARSRLKRRMCPPCCRPAAASR
jgi:hypothetical protein